MLDASLRVPEPIIVSGLFGAERAAILTLLTGLTDEEWSRPTIRNGWTGHDIAVHVLGGYAGNLARRRDRFAKSELPPGDDIVARLHDVNAVWVDAARRLSPWTPGQPGQPEAMLPSAKTSRANSPGTGIISSTVATPSGVRSWMSRDSCT
jgi:hypothetical protein